MAITWQDIKLRIEWTTGKEYFIYISLSILVCLVGTIVNDVVQTVRERTELTSQTFTMALLLVHDLGFFFAVLGFIYTTQAVYDTGNTVYWALLAIAGHILAFIVRISVDIAFVYYREESYPSAVDK